MRASQQQQQDRAPTPGHDLHALDDQPMLDRVFGLAVTPIAYRRWQNFKANKRGYWSLWIFLALFFFSLFAEFVANDRPLMVRYDGAFYFPVLVDYNETTFGGEFDLRADYLDPFVQDLIAEKGWAVWPLVPYSYDTILLDLSAPAPSAPSPQNWLGTDDQARDVTARMIYGFRISVVFGLLLALVSSVIGILSGAVQGYFGGLTDLLFQRFIEIWSGLPSLFILIIMASVITPGFFTLLIILVAFSWTALIGVVRAEFLRARSLDYVKAATALGVSNRKIMFSHMLPNAMVATITMMPFILSGAVTALTGLDFLGFGLPPGSASLGELLKQGKSNLEAPWLGLTGFLSLAVMLSLLVFIGEAVRDAFDPRKLFNGVKAAETAVRDRQATPSEPQQEGVR
jgi:microcin C transport system permease protein|tara:strand:- start:804 stop:2003 length:1200 start_codon:yes stop_codon:yes gene_type:complete